MSKKIIEKFGTDRFEDTDEFRKLKKLVDIQAKEIEGMSEVEFEKFVKPLKKEQQASETMYWGFKKMKDYEPKKPLFIKHYSMMSSHFFIFLEAPKGFEMYIDTSSYTVQGSDDFYIYEKKFKGHRDFCEKQKDRTRSNFALPVVYKDYRGDYFKKL